MKKLLLFCFFPTLLFSQSLDYENIVKSKPFKVSGQVSANGVYYNSSQNNNRAPFTYFLQGIINVNIYSFSVPISYSFSNQGENLDYQLPFDFNRISLHPKYKWITGHVGTVSMNFSPYTLNGHQFTGGGVDLTPPGAIKVSAMTGRLLKATEDTEDVRTVPAYNRMGYGLKASIEKERYTIGVIGFYAKDDQNSIDSIPEAKGVLPQENLVLSLQGKVKLGNSFSLEAEYANTAITKDIRAEESSNEDFTPAALLFNNRSSTAYYNAFKTRLGYVIGSVNLGLGYERIDPGYETLGAYYFNNDFENITLDAANTFFNNKLSLSLNIGYQRDDLDNIKANSTNRTVGALNANLMLSDRLTLGATYSNFSTFTNIKPNQFEEINDGNVLDEELENLDYRQLSQTATLNVNYVLSTKETKRQNLALNYALNDVANEQGGVVRIGDASTFHNLNGAYTIDFAARNLSVNTGLNATYNTIGTMEATTWGPTLAIAKRYFEKTLNTRISGSYSTSNNATNTTSVVNLRGNVGYVLKKQHNFNLTAAQLFRYGVAAGNTSDFTATFGYTYSFGLKKPKINLKTKEKKPKKKREKVSNDTISIKYKKYYFKGIPTAITPQLIAIPNNGGFQFLSKTKTQKLQELETQLYDSERKNKRIYKSVALAYLKSLSDYIDFETLYNSLVYKAYIKLVHEGRGIDRHFEEEYIKIHGKVNSASTPNTTDVRRMQVIDQRYNAHKKMLSALIRWNLTLEDVNTATGDFKEFRDNYLQKTFEMHDRGETTENIIDYLEIHLADYFHKVIEE